MRLNWIVNTTYDINDMNVREGANAFFQKHGVVPETVKMSFGDMNTFLTNTLRMQNIVYLEKGKQYSQFIAIPGGMLELGLLEQDDEATAHAPPQNQHSYSTTTQNNSVLMVFESTLVDKEFEKHILKSPNG